MGWLSGSGITREAINFLMDFSLYSAIESARENAITNTSYISGFRDGIQDDTGINTGLSSNYIFHLLSRTLRNSSSGLLFLGNFNGSNGSTVTSDMSQNNFSTTLHGSAILSTTTPKYGTASLLLQNTDSWLQVNSNETINSGSAGTFECWVNPTYASNGILFAWASEAVVGSFGYAGLMVNINSDNTLKLFASSSNSSWDIALDTTIATGLPTTWFHLAVVYNGSDIKTYINGVLASTTVYGGSIADAQQVQPLLIGRESGGTFFNGRVDDFRVTIGVEKYTSNFTPPIELSPSFSSMTLISNPLSVSINVTDGRIVLLRSDISSITLDVDLRFYMSRNGGANFTQIDLEEIGNINGFKIFGGDVYFTHNSTKSIVYRLQTFNNKPVNFAGVCAYLK